MKFKKLFAILSAMLCVGMAVCFTACNSSNENDSQINNEQNNNDESDNTDEEEQQSSVELTIDNYSEYIGVREEITVERLTIRELGGIYIVSGSGTLTYTVYPKRPIKCYNVSIQCSNNSPYGIAWGINVEFDGTPDFNVPADGNLTYEVDLTFTNNEDEFAELAEQIIIYGRDSDDMAVIIENTFVYVLSRVNDISGYVVPF